MGLYRGSDYPFRQNLQSAKNFSQALSQTLSQHKIEWKVILTGTDATLPSNHRDTIVEWNNATDIPASTHQLQIKSYKIRDDNYIYAMSKLGQFYIVADAISTMQNINTGLSAVAKKIAKHIFAAGHDGSYDPNNDNIIPKSELDYLSIAWFGTVQPSLLPHLVVANGLTILYTLPHCKYWVEEAVSKRHEDKFDSIKAHVIHEVVDSMDCAMSTSMGNKCHLRHASASTNLTES